MRNTRIIETLARAKIFLGNGEGYVSDFKYPVILAIGLKVLFPNTEMLELGIIALMVMIIIGIVGWVDLRFIKLTPTIAEINTRDYNPYFKELEKKINGESFK